MQKPPVLPTCVGRLLPNSQVALAWEVTAAVVYCVEGRARDVSTDRYKKTGISGNGLMMAMR